MSRTLLFACILLGACQACLPYSAPATDGLSGDGPKGDGGRTDSDGARRDGPRTDGAPPQYPCPVEKWCWVHPLPHGNRFTAVWAAPASAEVFAVGDAATIYHSLDGKTWSAMTAPAGAGALNGVWGSAPKDVFAVGSGGAIVHYDGKSWTKMSSSTTSELTAVWGSGPADVIAVGRNGTALRYDGSTWGAMSSGLAASAQLLAVAGTGPSSDVYAAGGGAKVYRYKRGVGWGEINTLDSGQYPAAMLGIWVSPTAQEVFVVGSGGHAWLHTPSDGAWASIKETGAYKAVHGVWGVDSSNVFAAAGDELLRYQGGSLGHLADASGELRAVSGRTASEVFFVGGSGAVLKYSGSQLVAQHPKVILTPRSFSSVWGRGPADIFAVGEAGTIVHFDGSAWKLQTSGTTEHLAAVWGDAQHVWAVGTKGTIRRYDGISWGQQASGTTHDLEAIWGADGSHIFAVGLEDSTTTKPTILFYNGAGWSPMATSGLTGSLKTVWGSKASNVYAAGEALLRYDGTSWTKIEGLTLTNDDYFTAVWGRSESDVFVSTRYKSFHFDGNGWTQMASSFDALWGNATEVFGVSSWGIARHTGGGWLDQESPCGYPLRGIWGSGNVVYAVGDGGAIISTTLSP